MSERPGTTRDSVDVRFQELDGLPFLAIDTAGVEAHRRRSARAWISTRSTVRSGRSAPRRTSSCCSSTPRRASARLDKQLADYIAQQHKPCIFSVNKWDLMVNDLEDPSQGNMGRFANLIQHAFRTMSYMPIAFITAKTGKNVKALLNLAQSLYKQSQRRVGTGTLNRGRCASAVDSHPPVSRENRTPRIYYATQVDVAPPTIVLFVNSTRLFDATYQRYLLNVFRQKLPFHDIPIKLYLRSRKQEEPGGRPSGGRSEEADEIEVAVGSGEFEQVVERAAQPPRPSDPSTQRVPPSRGQRAPGRSGQLNRVVAPQIGRRRGRPDPEQRHAGCRPYLQYVDAGSPGSAGSADRQLRPRAEPAPSRRSFHHDTGPGLWDGRAARAGGRAERIPGPDILFLLRRLQGEVRQGVAAIRPARVGDGEEES